MLWRPKLLVDASIALVVLAPGCASLDREFEREGSEPPARVDSARFLITTLPPEEGEELPKELVANIEGQISHHGERLRFGLDIPSVPGGVPGTDIEFIRIEGGDLYMRAPADQKALPEGKEWVVIPPNLVGQATEGFEDYIEYLTNGDFLRQRSFPDDERTGSALVRGIRTDVYSSSVDVEEMAEAVELDAEQVRDIKSFTGSEMEMRTWLDEGGFVRRMDMPMTLSDGLGGEPDRLILRIELFDHGADEVDVEEPPPSKVLEG